MKKVALVFLLAVFVPSLLLAWLAVRSLRDHQFVVERQQSLLYQGVADALAKEVVGLVTERRREFNQQVEALLATETPRETANSFDARLRAAWPLAEVGFAVSLDGQVVSPSLFGSPLARQFRLENDRFLCSRETVEVYWNSPKGAINLSKLDQGKDDSKKSPSKDTGASPSEPSAAPDIKADNMAPQQAVYASKFGKVQNVMAPANAQQTEPPPTRLNADEGEFRHLIGDATEGTLARFLQNKLNLLFWYRSQRDPQLVFGAQVGLARLTEQFQSLLRVEPGLQNEICAALLDDTARPVALSQSDFQTTWKRPFVAADISEVLPHWEVAVYLRNPASLGRSAQTLKLVLGLIIAGLVLAIGIGSWLIVSDLKREMTLARQKTDFVSNVSHELKTPLTSIRMFAELLAEGRVTDVSKQRSYLNIITAETARLTRLINNVLDFARLERGEKKYSMQRCDLAEVVRETVETYRPHLEANGFQFTCELPDAPVSINGDRDALAQVLVNLLSNAEKYANGQKEVSVELRQRNEPKPCAEVRVRDRGLGVPRGFEEKIFEQFFRAHDSLSSGIQGSGLGLTLARQIARAHGGDVVYEPREGGGSCFVFRIPWCVVCGG